MHIIKVEIHNFRSILDTVFDCGDYNLIVGENNSGKSNIVAAILAFFESSYKIDKNSDDFPKLGTKDKNSWVNILFRLNDEEFKSLPDDYKNDNHLLFLHRNLNSGELYGIKEDGSLYEKQFIAQKNISQGKLGNIVYIPAISKISDEVKLTGPSAFRNLVQDLIKGIFHEGNICVDNFWHHVI